MPNEFEPIPTVRICDPHKPDDYLIINLRDFDPETQTLWGQQTAEALGDLRALGVEAVATGDATAAEVAATIDGLKETADPTVHTPEFDESETAQEQPASPQNQLGLGERAETAADPANTQSPATGVPKGRARK